MDMVTGRELRLPSDPRLPTAVPETLYASSFIRRMHANLFRAHELARQHLQSADRRQKDYFGRRQTTHTFQPGDRVWLLDPVPPPSPRSPHEVPPPLDRTLQG
ncbi:hypothetical protein FGIG_00682 [Fasciola gigantica]|uniref:Uncharacterized protein n=1 Tax=Fasciola gigantica TaxID=46835 RepID=A0A504YNB1_FASGI|nr:hypothetical protein FGIG_00682 [Fasciola gigantica]